MNFKSKKIVPVILAVLTLFITACQSSDTTQPQQSSNTPEKTEASSAKESETNRPEASPKTSTSPRVLNVGITNAASNFAAYTSFESVQWGLSSLMFDTLYKVDMDANYEKFLAESVTTDDSQTFIIKLKEALWTDNTPITSDDAIYTIYLYANPVVNSTQSQYFSVIEGLNSTGRLDEGKTDIPGIKKIDDLTFSVTTQFPVSTNYFLGNIGCNLRPLPKHIFEKFDLENLASNNFNISPDVTSGAYKLKKYEVDQYIQFVPNELYYQGAPQLDELNFKILTASNIAVQIQSGEIDFNINGIGNINIDDYDSLKDLPNAVLHVKEAVQCQLLEINTDIFEDAKVRQAISLAINRDLIVQQVLKGMGAPIYNPFSPSAKFNNDAVKPEYDKEKAKALLEETNFDFNKEYIFIVPTGNQKREQAGEVITQNLTEIGIKVVIEKYDFATSTQKAKNGDYAFFIRSTGPSEDNPISGFKGLYGTGGGNNISNISDSVLDELFEKALHEQDDSKQADIISNIQLRLQEIGSPSVGIYAESQLQAVNKRAVNIRIANSSPIIIANAFEWTVKEE